MKPFRVPFRKLNDSLRFTLPPWVVREMDLTMWDHADVTLIDKDTFTVRVTRVRPPTTQLAEPAE
jgi:hypothetical protein